MIEKIKIKKIGLIANFGQKIEISSSGLKNFFLISRINPKRPLKTFFLKLNKTKLIKIISTAYFRKITKKGVALTEQALISLIFPKIKFRKILRLEVYILGKKISFDLKDIHLLNLLGDLRGVIVNNQYALDKKNIKNKIVIDAGSHNGEFSLLAVLMGAKKVYAFEPVSKTNKILLTNIKINGLSKKIKVIPKALGDKNETAIIHFDFVGDGAARIGSKIKSKDSEKIEVIKLDDFIKKNKISKIGFIKMDVEGFEENVLLGAKKIIEKDKPVLSLSAYHKTSDKKRLPKIIKSLREDYKIALNNFDEENFYCY